MFFVRGQFFFMRKRVVLFQSNDIILYGGLNGFFGRSVFWLCGEGASKEFDTG